MPSERDFWGGKLLTWLCAISAWIRTNFHTWDTVSTRNFLFFRIAQCLTPFALFFNRLHSEISTADYTIELFFRFGKFNVRERNFKVDCGLNTTSKMVLNKLFWRTKKKKKSISFLVLLIWYKLKSGSHLPKENFYLLQWKPFPNYKKNSFYFILKVHFVLKILKFLTWRFGHVEKGFH